MKRLRSRIFFLLLALGSQYCTLRPVEREAPRRPETVVNTSVRGIFDDFNVNYRTFETDTDENQLFSLDNGTLIRVPAGAFSYADGRPVKGKVQIKYREFHTAAELIAGGIPTDYDSANLSLILETGGAFDIRALQNETEVFIAEGKIIRVSLASYDQSIDYGKYFLREEPYRLPPPTSAAGRPTPSSSMSDYSPGKWEYLGPAETELNRMKFLRRAETELNLNLAADRFADSLNRKLNAGELPEVLLTYFGKQAIFKIPADSSRYPKIAGKSWRLLSDSENGNPYAPQNSWVLRKSDKKTEITDIRIEKGVKISVQTVKAHAGQINSAVYSADGRFLLTAGNDKTAVLRDSEGRVLQRFLGHEGVVTSAVFSPDGQQILTGSSDGTAVLWSIGGDPICQFKGHTGSVNDVAFSPDGQYVLTGSSDETLKLWTPDGKLKSNLGFLFDHIVSVGFSPDGRYVASGSRDGTIRIRDLRSSGVRSLVGAHKGGVNSVDWAPDSKHLVSTGLDGKVKLWTAEGTGRMVRKFTETGVLSALFSGDGQKLFVQTSSAVKIYDRQGELLRNLNEPLGTINTMTVSPNGRYLVTGSVNKTLKIWDLNSDNSAEETFTLEIHATDRSDFLPKEKYFTALVRPEKTGTFEQMLKRLGDQQRTLYKLREKKKTMFAQGEKLVEEAEILRDFEVRNCGVYNVDRLYDPRNSATVELPIAQNNELLNPTSMFLITGRRGTAVQRLRPGVQSVHLDPEMKNILLVVLADGRVAFCDSSSLDRLARTALTEKNTEAVRLHVTAEPVRSADELSRILY